MKENKLFSNFNPTTIKEWETKIKVDLKGADYNKRLITKTIDGINIKPYYVIEELANIELSNTQPGEFPYIRGNTTVLKKHRIRQNIFVNDYSKANKKAKDIISKGITSIGFILSHKESVPEIDFLNLLSEINISEIETNFISGKNSEIILKYLLKYITDNKIKAETVSGSLDFDPLGHKTIYGNCYNKQNCNFSNSLEILYKLTENKLENFRIFSVNSQNFKNAGSSSVQEVAYGLSIANDYLVKASELNIPIEKFANKIQFTFGIGSNYFIEIAKIRAARVLWAKIIEAYKIDLKNIGKMYVHSETCTWNKTIYDPYVNILRTTTESMSAILGGTDSLLVKPFNSSFEQENDFSERIARNTQIILNEEAYFDKTIDPSGGAYYIESLTNSIAEHSWNLFLEIEKEGGYNIAFDKGIIKEKIEETANKRNINIAIKKEILLGTNQYPNRNESIKISKKETKSVHPKALKLYRASEAFEDLRQKTERASKIPKVFLFPIGNITMRKARSAFAANFFSCAGFKIIDNTAFNSIEDGIKICKDSKAEITVICSSDKEYIQYAPEIFKNLKTQSIIVIAGKPKDSIDNLKEIGIEHFISIKSNILETLKNFQKELGLS